MIPFEIRGFPMPPSANALYANGRNGGRFKTQKLRAYEADVKIWALKNNHIIQAARSYLANLSFNQALIIERVFYQKGFRILTKDGRPRKNDTSNRLKALDDALAELLGIDDCLFWDGDYKKRPSAHSSLGEYVDIKLSPMELDFQFED